MKKELIIHEWPTEGGTCYEVVDTMPESWEDDETYYKVSQTHINIKQDSKEKLLKFCQDFIKTQKIICSESIYQTDRVIENAYEFIDGVCEIVGFHKDEPEEICQECGSTEDVTTGPDPYVEEICNKTVIVTLCASCYHEACMDI